MAKFRLLFSAWRSINVSVSLLLSSPSELPEALAGVVPTDPRRQATGAGVIPTLGGGVLSAVLNPAAPDTREEEGRGCRQSPPATLLFRFKVSEINGPNLLFSYVAGESALICVPSSFLSLIKVEWFFSFFLTHFIIEIIPFDEGFKTVASLVPVPFKNNDNGLFSCLNQIMDPYGTHKHKIFLLTRIFKGS